VKVVLVRREGRAVHPKAAAIPEARHKPVQAVSAAIRRPDQAELLVARAGPLVARVGPLVARTQVEAAARQKRVRRARRALQVARVAQTRCVTLLVST
jgi:hypothetical protein